MYRIFRYIRFNGNEGASPDQGQRRRMTESSNDIHAQAESLAVEFRALGRSVTVSHSTNRNGDHSSYLSVSGLSRRIRVSDHFSGTTDAVDAFGSAADMIAAAERSVIDYQVKREDEMAERDAREAPFKARYLAATENKKAIIIECYPSAWANKAAQKEIAARWRA